MSKDIKIIPYGMALLPIIFLVLTLGLTILLFNEPPHLALIFSTGIATLVALIYKYQWKEIETHMVHGIASTIIPILILLLIGMMIGTWILAGVVPAMIYYGLQILSPKIFLLATLLICSIVSLGTGSSWSTAGTIGVALIVVGRGMGIPIPLVAGAIISGSYFGDKMSPLSDSTNLAPAIAGTDLFTHIKHMVYTTVPSYIIAAIIYTCIGLTYSDGIIEHEKINNILHVIQRSYNINIFLLLPPLFVIIMVVKKVAAMPALLLGAIIGAIFAVVFQSSPLQEVFNVAYSGFQSHTGNAMVDNLLSRGGLAGMYSTVALILCALSFGGVMDGTGMLNIIMNPIISRIKRVGPLVASTNLTTIALNFITPDQYVAEVLSGRMYKETFKELNLKPKNLSRCLEDSGTLTSPLVPWNTCGAFMWATLGVCPFLYLPFAFFNLINPCISILYGFTGFTMEKIEDKSKKSKKNKSCIKK